VSAMAKEYKDIILVILIITPFTFFDVRTALFVGATGTSIVILRRTILFLSPARFKNHGIPFAGEEWPVPKGVEILELSNSATLGIIYTYVEVLRSMDISMRILIIRFKQIHEMNPFDLCLLDEVISRLTERGIIIYLSEVDGKVRELFNKYNLMQKVGRNEIFYKMEEALLNAKISLEVNHSRQISDQEEQRNKIKMN
jgi:MFS superfamily sulfate permease-like transporter